MARYLRPRRPGASLFFTVALADRGSDLLVREIGRLRQAVAATMQERPFTVEAWVVLPDHLHAVRTLPEGEADYSVRWGAIKARFTMSLRRVNAGQSVGRASARHLFPPSFRWSGRGAMPG